ncbi:MAG: hypothetical protein NWF06_00930 [Candidatus Bathyarchaeota archaeon]|nr:hypothetical protein [Candidatus Bathyarchaeum sp.]
MAKLLCSVFLLLILGVGMFCVVLVSATDSEAPVLLVPEFTAKFVVDSYYTEPTYSIDPFTGENITTAGYLVEKDFIEFNITTQHFTPYLDQDGNWVAMFYNIKFKGHYEDEWKYYPYDPNNNYHTPSYSATFNASQTNYTTLSVRVNVAQSGGINLGVPDGGQVDFQVQALKGYITKVYTGSFGLFWAGGEMDHYYVFTGETSNWSNTQTAIFEKNAQTIPEFQPWILIPLLIGGTTVAAIQKKKLTKKVTK